MSINKYHELKKVFDSCSNEVIEHRTKELEDKLSFLNMLQGDLNKYKESFPNIPEQILKYHYFEYLDQLDLINRTKARSFTMVKKYSEQLILKMFSYVDFIDLVKYAQTEKLIWNHIFGFDFFSQRLVWERQTYRHVKKCIHNKTYHLLVSLSRNPIETIYKNHIALKRYLPLINPPDDHPLKNFSIYDVFKSIATKKFRKLFATKKQFDDFVAQSFNLLDDDDLIKYKHSCAIAKRYGFVYCFRRIKWYNTNPKPYIDLAGEPIVLEKLKEYEKDFISKDNEKKNIINKNKKDKDYDKKNKDK
tara:strand:- start:22403 stop:23314 length:912 start_codon:yes stop_codon:yes gene_type:complete